MLNCSFIFHLIFPALLFYMISGIVAHVDGLNFLFSYNEILHIEFGGFEMAPRPAIMVLNVGESTDLCVG